MSATDKPRSGMNRRDVLRGSAGLVLGATAFGIFTGSAYAQEQVLKIAHGTFDMDWSPMRGGGPPSRWLSLWWAAPMYFNSRSEIQPYVVTSWEPSEDLKTWTFKLDPKAVFSDGSQITAADIKGSWELAAMPSSRHQRVNQVLDNVVGYDDVTGGSGKELSGVVATDDGTLTVTLKEADPIFFLRVANHLIPIVKASEARDDNGEEVLEWWAPDQGGVSSGPFKIVEMNLDDGFLAFEPNENFFGPKPKLTRVEIRVVEDPVTATTLLQKGEFHAHTELVTSTIVKDLGKEFSMGPSIPSGQHFWFNVKTAPFDDPNIRKALILAVDRDGLMKASFPDGPYTQAQQILVALPGVDDKLEPIPHDPEQAKQLLAASKYGTPDRLPRLIMAGITSPAHQAAAQFIIEQWRQNLGITAVEIKPTLDNFSPADVHIIRDDAGTRVPDAAAYLRGVIHSTSGVATNKMNGYNNPQVDAKLDEAVQKLADDPARISLTQEAQRLFHADFAYLPWYHEVMSRWALKTIGGMDKNLDWQVVQPWDITIG